jgi:hypothetical protein
MDDMQKLINFHLDRLGIEDKESATFNLKNVFMLKKNHQRLY